MVPDRLLVEAVEGCPQCSYGGFGVTIHPYTKGCFMSFRSARFALVALAVPTLLMASSAHAAPSPAMRITKTTITNTAHTVLLGFKICGIGNAANTGQWQLAADGSRSDGSSIQAVVGGPGTAFNQCFNVYTNGAASGSFNNVFAFAGVGLDVAGAADLTVSWYGTSPTQVLFLGT